MCRATSCKSRVSPSARRDTFSTDAPREQEGRRVVRDRRGGAMGNDGRNGCPWYGAALAPWRQLLAAGSKHTGGMFPQAPGETYGGHGQGDVAVSMLSETIDAAATCNGLQVQDPCRILVEKLHRHADTQHLGRVGARLSARFEPIRCRERSLSVARARPGCAPREVGVTWRISKRLNEDLLSIFERRRCGRRGWRVQHQDAQPHRLVALGARSTLDDNDYFAAPDRQRTCFYLDGLQDSSSAEKGSATTP